MKKNLTKVIFLILALALAIVPVLAISSFAAEGAGRWELVTDVSELNAGDKIIIVASASNYALGTTQNNNNRNAVSIVKDGTNGEIINSIGSTVQEITLEEGSISGTFSFNVGTGYLYAAGGTSAKNNYMRTQSHKDSKASWNISIANGVATITTADSTVVKNTLMKNSSGALFSCYSGGQGTVSIYKLTSNTSTEEYTSTFYVDGVVDETISGKGLTNFPAAPTLAEGYSDYTFVGWATEEALKTATCPVVFEENAELSISENTSFYAVFTYKESVLGAKGYEDVTNSLDNLESGTVVVITMSKGDIVYVLPNDKATSAPTPVQMNGEFDGAAVTDAVKWYIGKGEGGGYTFQSHADKNNYLYNINNNNGVRVNGESEYKGYNEYTINNGYLYNTSRGRYIGIYLANPDWRSYTTYTGTSNIAGQTLGIYAEVTVDGETVVDYYTSTLPGAKLDRASVTIGDNLAMNYYVSILKSGTTMEGCSVKFTFNGDETLVDSYTLVDGKYMFTFNGILPEQMGDAIRAELIDSNGETIDVYSGYTVKQNLEDLLNNNPTDKLKNLINATLIYGAAAQQYRDYNTDNLVAEIPGDLNGPNKENVRKKTDSTVDGLEFTAAGVNFDYCNRVYARFKNTNNAENVSVKVTIDGVECAFETFVNNGVTTIYSDALKATQLDSKVVFQIYQGESLVQQLTYSVNDYVFGMKNTDDVVLKNLIFALYQYGVAAKAYNN